MKTKKLLSIGIIVITVVLFAYYIYNHISDFAELRLVNPIWLIPLLLIFLAVSWTNGLIIKYLAEPFNIRLSFREWFGLSFVTSFYNMITPFKGGLAAKAVYMKQKHAFAYADYLATVAGLYVINFFVASIIGLASLWRIYSTYGIFNWIILVIFLGFSIPLLGIILFSPRFPESRYNFINQFIKVMNGWNSIKSNKKIIAISALIIVAQILLNSLSTIISYNLFGVSISLSKAIFLMSIGSLSLLIQITPAGLGINEAIAVFSGLIVGITPAQSLAVAILARIVGMFVIFSLGPIFSYILFKHKPKLQDETH